MVLQPRGCGRVGRRRTTIGQRPPVIWWPLRHFTPRYEYGGPWAGAETLRRSVRPWPRTVEDSDQLEVAPAPDEVARHRARATPAVGPGDPRPPGTRAVAVARVATPREVAAARTTARAAPRAAATRARATPA